MKFQVVLLLFICLAVVEVRSAKPAEVTPDQSPTNSAGDVVTKPERLIQAPPPPSRAGGSGDRESQIQGYSREHENSDFLDNGYPASPPREYEDSDFPNNGYPASPSREYGDSDFQNKGHPTSPPREYGDSDFPNNGYPASPPRGYEDSDFQNKGHPASPPRGYGDSDFPNNWYPSPSRGSGAQGDGLPAQFSGINDILSILNPTSGGDSSGVNLEESLKKGLVPSLLTRIVKLLGAVLSGVFGSLSGLLPQLLGTVIGLVGNLLESLFGRMLSGVMNGVKDGLLNSDTVQRISRRLVSQLRSGLFRQVGVQIGSTNSSRRPVWPYQQHSHRSGI